MPQAPEHNILSDLERRLEQLKNQGRQLDAQLEKMQAEADAQHAAREQDAQQEHQLFSPEDERKTK
jgi:hypothetical protein